jgi:hypothetical protein
MEQFDLGYTYYSSEGEAIMALTSQIAVVRQNSSVKMFSKRKVVVTVPERIPN